MKNIVSVKHTGDVTGFLFGKLENYLIFLLKIDFWPENLVRQHVHNFSF